IWIWTWDLNIWTWDLDIWTWNLDMEPGTEHTGGWGVLSPYFHHLTT
ncbi:MAG: hypothetical protein QOH35_898, partial [Acidobacteriaceae bacterium]|nr:hypothetical protein [Acidobacteriaceae bacterium]